VCVACATASHDADLERHAKHLAKSAKSSKALSLEKTEAAKPFYAPFAPIDKEAVEKYWKSATDTTKSLWANPVAWWFFWPMMMWWPYYMWGWYAMSWMWYMPWMYMGMWGWW